MESNPVLLSICLPTYNRSQWLRSSLSAWYELVNGDPRCEIVVSDNHSPDGTPAVIEQINVDGSIRVNRNPENLPSNGYICVAELARGKFVWLVGDDDLPTEGVVQRVLEAIETNPDVPLLFAPYATFLADAPPDHIIRAADIRPVAQFHIQDRTPRRVEQLRELIALDWNCFTPIYCAILRRDVAVEAYKGALTGPPFATAESVSSHALYIARHLQDQPAYHLGETCLIASSNCSWEPFLPIQFLEHVPYIYDTFEAHGASRQVMDAHRNYEVFMTGRLLVQMLGYKDTPMRDKFSLKRYIWRHRRCRSLPRVLLFAGAVVFYLKIPRVITRGPLLAYRWLKKRIARR